MLHFVPEYFLQPVHPISVALIGAGGSGSQMLSALARINHALRCLGQPGLDVTVYDPDTVQEPNIGRQLFTSGELGQNKAEALVSRFNRVYGIGWKACPRIFDAKNDKFPNITVTCVDRLDARKEIAAAFRKRNITKAMIDEYHRKRGGAAFNEYNENYAFYWLDLGNGQRTGQAILGSNRVPQPESSEYRTTEYLPVLSEQFRLNDIKEEDSGPSCSMAEALSKQDLFINSVLVQTAASLLWSILTDAAIDTRGFFVNLDTYRTAPITIKAEDVMKTPGRHALRKRNPEKI